MRPAGEAAFARRRDDKSAIYSYEQRENPVLEPEQEARFLVNALRLLQHHLGERARGGRLQPLGATLAFISREGELVLPLAVDHLSWTGQMQRFFDQASVAVTPRTVLVTGAISLPAQRALTQRGWSLVPHLPYPDAPPYAPSPATPQRG